MIKPIIVTGIGALIVGILGLAGCGTENAPGWDGTSDGQDTTPHPDGTGEGFDSLYCDPTTCFNYCVGQGFLSGQCNSLDETCTCNEQPPPDETCNNGIDDDFDGLIDENCGCTAGTTQPCYTGPPTTRGVGFCMDGAQTCVGEMEFIHWGPCEGEILPSEDLCEDIVDNDCDGEINEYCPSVCYPVEFGVETICNNGIDDECDGLIDCADPDCACCTPADEICSDRIDNDCDGRTDCFDLMDCLISPPPEDCYNGVDDDCDRYVDCDDTDCCEITECYDPTKCGLPCCIPGTTRWCDTPSYCSWGSQECLSDGTWGTCEETTDRPPGCEGGTYYDRECCLSAGECCMNYPYDDTSVGDCGGIAVDCP
jgi:hypothetical protein